MLKFAVKLMFFLTCFDLCRYDVMNNCWLVAPVDRPTFSQLVGQLDDILNTDNEAAVFDKDDDLYINVPHL